MVQIINECVSIYLIITQRTDGGQLEMSDVHFCESSHLQGGGTHICCALRSLSMVKIKFKGQLEIFFMVNSQATIIISLIF